MNTQSFYQRHLQARIVEALADTPVVLLHGPRQSGKTTLARHVGAARGYAYVTFDDDTQRAAAESDPVGFVADLPERVVLDEVQRVPGLFTSLKAAVDARRLSGRFILTGSANVLFLPRLADSLAGRMEVLCLRPLTQAELAETPPDFLPSLFGGGFKPGPFGRRMGAELADRVAAGGYPAALARASSPRRMTWYRDYVQTLVQRDVRDLARIGALDALPRLMALAAGQSARLLNVAELAAPFQLSRPTIRDYVTLLSRLFLLEELAPWHSNRISRLIKTPKIHLGDTGLGCALLGVDGTSLWRDRGLYGQLLETFVFQELRRQADGIADSIAFYHFRDKDGAEVDVVLESGGMIAGVEVKAGATVKSPDFRGLRMLRGAAGTAFARGVLLYDGEAVVPFGDDLYAVPISRLWSSGHQGSVPIISRI
jgi:predicted AAA+ superfamily ATPase